MAAQNRWTRAVLDALPQRAALHRRFLDLLGAGSVSAPAVAGGRVFTLEREGDAEQAVIVVRSATDAEAPARVLVDPHGLAADHAAAVDWISPSPDGHKLAYGVSEAGSEHGVLRIVDVESGALLPDAISPVRHPSPAWLPDGSAFAYSRLPEPGTVPAGEEGYWERLYWHELGAGPGEDSVLLGEELGRTALPVAAISPDGRWLVLHVHLMPTRTDVTVVDRSTGRRTVVVEGEEAWTWGQVVDDRFYAITSLGARRGRVVSAPVESPEVEHWVDVVAEGPAVIEGLTIAGPSLLVSTTEHAVSHLWRYGLDGSGGTEIPLPGPGALGGIDAEARTERAFLAFTSFARPSALWRWDAGAGLQPWSRHSAPLDPASYGVRQVVYESTDGAAVPMFLIASAGPRAAAPSPQPTVLTAYGGFAITSTPAFSPGLVAWCDAGGLYAVAGIRGGGEYGEEWHEGGRRHRKQQAFDDFAAAAGWLVDQGLTVPERLAIRGGSNGGLLVGATITQRPDLCRAAVCAVPLLDMLRYDRFLIGALWVPEYGDPADPEDFKVLSAYSPYHRIVDGFDYPATLVTTAESDSRVHPMHALKFAARLQAAQAADDRPVLLRVETRAGHGLGKPRGKQADELADTWAFVFWQLGLAIA